MPVLAQEKYLRLRLTGEEEPFPALSDISNFLYDFNLLYELVRLSVDAKHRDFRFSQFVYYRKGRPLDDSERLLVESLQVGSPFVLIAVIGAVGAAIAAVGGTVTIFQAIQNAKLNRRKLQAEVEKLERENRDSAEAGSVRAIGDVESIKQVLRMREAEYYVDSTGRRLAGSPVRIREIDIELVSGEILDRDKLRHREPGE